MMDNNDLTWSILSSTPLLHTPVYDVLEQEEESATGIRGRYVAIQAPDWVMTIPVWNDRFVMVRQWRHSSEQLTLEFPGGVADPAEDPAVTAARELYEETGFRAGKLICLGSCSPNPALFKNRFHCFLATELTPTGTQHLDADELLRYELVPTGRVLEEFGSPEFSHGLMGTALAFYWKHLRKEGSV